MNYAITLKVALIRALIKCEYAIQRTRRKPHSMPTQIFSSSAEYAVALKNLAMDTLTLKNHSARCG